MALIKFIDSKTGNEVATCTSFDMKGAADTAGISTAGRNTILKPATPEDYIIEVDDFKTPVPPTFGIPPMNNRAQVQALNQIIACLVRAMGGAVTLTEYEIRSISGADLIVEQTSEGGMVMKVNK
jgi:hypothetical protein